MVNVQTLSDTFTPFDIKYAGLVPEIPSDIDPSGRTDLLKVLDQGKKDGQILTPEAGGLTLDAVLGINAYSIRITDKQSEEILLCAPVHMIASVGFVKEEGLNILPIKIGEIDGNKGVYDLAVIYCKTSDIAEMICNILGQCFQLVYQEATMQCFDDSRVNRAPAADIFSHKSTISSASRTNDGPEGPSFISGSRSDLSRPPAAGRVHLHQRSSTSPSESDRVSSGHPNELIQEYLMMLSSSLNQEELRQFAFLIKRWRGENLPFPEFIQKVLELYGSERKHLLARMRPFVHGPEEVRFFNRFLEKAGISENAESSMASNSPASDTYSRSIVDSSGELNNSLRLLMTTPFGTNTSSSIHIPDDDDFGSSSAAILYPPPRRRHRLPLGNVITEMSELAHESASQTQHAPSGIAEDKL